VSAVVPLPGGRRWIQPFQRYKGKRTQENIIQSPGITPGLFVHAHTSSFTVSCMRMKPADLELTSTRVIGYRAGVVDRVVVRMFRSAMVAFMNGL
jgi:hypothetical protein